MRRRSALLESSLPLHYKQHNTYKHNHNLEHTTVLCLCVVIDCLIVSLLVVGVDSCGIVSALLCSSSSVLVLVLGSDFRSASMQTQQQHNSNSMFIPKHNLSYSYLFFFSKSCPFVVVFFLLCSVCL